MELLYATLMLAAFLIAQGSLLTMVARRLPDLMRALSGPPAQSGAAARLMRA